MLDPVKVEVNGRYYTVMPMRPPDVFDYLCDETALLRSGQSLGPLGWRVFSHVYDPNGRKLVENNKRDNFISWFTEYPEDMLILQTEAVKALFGPFLKPANDTKNSETSSNDAGVLADQP